MSTQGTRLDWITFSTSHQVVGLNTSSTSLIRKISNSKQYLVEKPRNEISSFRVATQFPKQDSRNFPGLFKENHSFFKDNFKG